MTTIMKRNKAIYILGAVIMLIAAGTGCSKNDFNINRNPNQPTDSTITYDVILPAALHGTGATIAGDWGWLQNWMGYWARSGSYAPNFTEETYQITTGFQTAVWNNLYNNAYDYQVMQNKAKQAGAKYYEGVARIMKAHDFQILVDVYNNVPYFEALKGSANSTPKYDKAVDIYKDLFRQIDTGISLIKSATASQSVNIDKNDIMFGGDKTMWAKFGNTLKLRMLVHMHNGITGTQVAAGINVADEVAKITAEGSGFLGSGQTADVQPGYRDDKPNPFWAVYKTDNTGTATQGSAFYRANEWGIDYYALYNGDPRYQYFYAAGVRGFVGVKYGLPAANENAGTQLATIGTGLARSTSQAQWILTSTESLFLQSEARQRGILTTGPSAQALWEQAIIDNFVWLGSTAATGQAFINANANTGYPDVDFVADPLYAIMSQKWFSLNGIAPFEVWTDYRRTGIVYGEDAGYDPGPPISVSPNNTATKIPTRLLYPQTEYNYNAGNVAKEGTIERYGRVFWDLN
jgi:hypothetical protein